MAGPTPLLRENCPLVVASTNGVGGNDGILSAQQYEDLLAGGTGLVSVTDYGALGNGTTDDGPAVQLAFDAAKAIGGTVYFPPVSDPETMGYKIVTPVSLSFVQGAAIRFGIDGCGDASPIIVATGTGVDCIALDTTGLEWFTGYIGQLTFRTSHLATDGSTKDCRRAISIAGSSSDHWQITGPLRSVGVSADDYVFNLAGAKFSLGHLHNAGSYAISGGAPVYGFLHFDQANVCHVDSISSFGEYNWYGQGNAVPGLGATDALVKVTPSRSASWGPTQVRITELLSSSRDGNFLYCYQPTGALRAKSIIVDNARIEAGTSGGAIISHCDFINLRGVVWRAGSSKLLLDAYEFVKALIEGVRTDASNTDPNYRGDGSGTIHLIDSNYGTVTPGSGGQALIDSGPRRQLAVYTNATHPAANAVTAGTMIFNSDDNFPNVSDGTNWRDMSGGIT